MNLPEILTSKPDPQSFTIFCFSILSVQIEELIGLHLAHLAPTTAALSADAASGGGSNGDGSASSRKLSQKRQREVGDGQS